MKRQTVGNGRSAAASPRTLRKQHAQAVYQQAAGLRLMPLKTAPSSPMTSVT
jgi:hypothetical protein